MRYLRGEDQKARIRNNRNQLESAAEEVIEKVRLGWFGNILRIPTEVVYKTT